jgi:hypothetical protein
MSDVQVVGQAGGDMLALTTLHDHFSCVPQMTTLQVERGAARAFPAASARPFAS